MVPTRFKQPHEVRTITFDFDTKLNTGDSVESVVDDELAVATGLTASTPAISLNQVTSLISGGTINSTYRISCLVTTTLGEKLELDVNIRVADGVN